MGRKKQPFVDKKTASVYHVVRRSQRDVVGAGADVEAEAGPPSDFVLMPSPENAARAERAAVAREEEEEEERGIEGDRGAASSSTTGENRAPAAVENSGNDDGRETKVDFQTLKSVVAKAGLLDSAASTYSRHTKPIRASGTFVSAPAEGHLYAPDADNLHGLFTNTVKNSLDEALEEAMSVREVGRMLDSIALTADCMDEDVAHALFDDFEEGEFEEITDDFCLTANREVLETDDDYEGGAGGDGFDFERHVQRLMEKARAQENGGDEGGRELEHDFFGGVTPLHGRIEEEEDEDDFDYDRYGEDENSLDQEFGGQSDEGPPQPAVTDEQQRVLCQKFEEALLEYDSDDVGDLDEECEGIGGDRALEGDAQLDAALDEFLTERKDEILIEGGAGRKRVGGSGYSALVGKTMVHASELGGDADASKALFANIEESKRQIQKDLADADAVLASPEMDLPPEEVFIDGKSYFSQTSRNPWDCESILSTYSNLDNNPVVIGRSKKKKKGKKKGVDGAGSVCGDAIPEEGPVKIQLSNKTGLPLGTFDDRPRGLDEDAYPDYGDGDTYLSVNLGEARNKSETEMEKKGRKQAIKEERKICRMQKKMLKEAFRDEFQKRGMAEAVDAVGGKAVFRIS